MDHKAIRAQFPAADECVHLNSASRSIIPSASVEAMTRFARSCHLVDPEKPSEFSNLITDVRSQAASLIGAVPSDIAISWNTSVPLNIVAQGLRLKRGDRVVVGRSEFPANSCVWENLRTNGVEVTVLPPGLGYTTPEDVRAAIDERTRVVALSFVSFHNGYRADVEEIGGICRERGVLFAVDGIQGVGAMELDVNKANIDVLATGGQKWLLAPFGTGFLYCSEETRRQLVPRFAGWLSVKGMDRTGKSVLHMPFELVEDSRRFEIGTLSYQDLAGFRESLKLILSVGVSEIQRHIFRLLDVLIEELKTLPVEIRSVLSPEHRSGIIAFGCGDPGRLKHWLAEEGIVVAEREGGIRVSPHVYNNEEDMERLCRALRSHIPRLA